MKEIITPRKARKRSFDPIAISLELAGALTKDLGSACSSRYTCVGENPIAQFFVKEQSKSILKKFDDGNTKNHRRLADEAKAKFVKVNAHMRGYTYRDLNLPLYHPRPDKFSGYTVRDDILITARKICHLVLGDITTEEIFKRCKHSSGSSIGVPFKDTSWESKFALPISGTTRAISLFNEYLMWNSSMRKALIHLWAQPFGLEGQPAYFPAGSLERDSFHVVDWSRASTVEKNSDARRFIAIEPTLNMFFQQGLMSVFYDRLATFGLDLSTAQPKHKYLARIASQTGKQATIDWSSASDCVSTDLTEYLLPRKWFEWIDSVRTGFVKIGADVHPCHMFATMGNAVTFPLETLVFWSIGIATVQCALARKNLRVPYLPDMKISQSNLVSVFGDDCIVPSEYAPLFIEVCTSVGFIINESKSFISPTPGFRESCGGDYFHGTDVRPFFMRAPTGTTKSCLEPWLYIIANRVLQKYIQYFGRVSYVYEKQFWIVLSRIFRKHKLKVKLVPPFFPEDSGITESDFVRLLPYGFRLDRQLKVGHMGSVSFRYLRYRFPENRVFHEELMFSRKLLGTYRNWTPLEQVRRDIHGTPIKEGGYYQEVRGVTSCWSPPSVVGLN